MRTPTLISSCVVGLFLALSACRGNVSSPNLAIEGDDDSSNDEDVGDVDPVNDDDPSGDGDDGSGDGDGTGDVDACGLNDGIGDACTTTDNCICNRSCAARSCVAKSACDQARLTWSTPTENTDGSCLTNIGGFSMYWGTTSGYHDHSVDVHFPCVETGTAMCDADVNVDSDEDGIFNNDADGSVSTYECTYLLTDLADGVTVYIVMTTYNTDSVESDPSGEVSKAIDCP